MRKTTCERVWSAALALGLGVASVSPAACGKREAAPPPVPMTPPPSTTREPAAPGAPQNTGAGGSSVVEAGKPPTDTPSLGISPPHETSEPTPEEIAYIQAQQVQRAQVAKVQTKLTEVLRQRAIHDERTSAAFMAQSRAEEAYGKALFAYQRAVADRAAWDEAEAMRKSILADAMSNDAQKKQALQAMGPHSAKPPAVPRKPKQAKVAQVPPLRLDPDAVRRVDALMYDLNRAAPRGDTQAIHDILVQIDALSEQLSAPTAKNIKQEIERLLPSPSDSGSALGLPTP